MGAVWVVSQKNSGLNLKNRMTDKPVPIKTAEDGVLMEKQEAAVFEAVFGGEWKKYARVTMAALGSIPWVGSIISAAATLSAENEQGNTNKLLFLWIQEHEVKLKQLGATLDSVFRRFESFGDRIKERIESEEYITLVRKTFKLWDESETLEKKEMLKKLIINAAGITISQDDLVRMFLEWIEKYHEFHFGVIAQIYKNPGITRGGIWRNIRGEEPRGDSSEAHLFKLLINDLSLGEVIHQPKDTNFHGDYLKRKPQKRNPTSTYQSAFEDTKPYTLTGLGSDFVHYVMEDLATQIEAKNK